MSNINVDDLDEKAKKTLSEVNDFLKSKPENTTSNSPSLKSCRTTQEADWEDCDGGASSL